MNVQNSKDRYKFRKEIIKSNIINDTGLYALDNFGGGKMINDDICNIMYNVKIGSNPIQVQIGWQEEKGMKCLILNGRTPYLQPAQPQEENKKLDMITQENKKTQTQGKEKKTEIYPRSNFKKPENGKNTKAERKQVPEGKIIQTKKEKLHKLKKEKR